MSEDVEVSVKIKMSPLPPGMPQQIAQRCNELGIKLYLHCYWKNPVFEFMGNQSLVDEAIGLPYADEFDSPVYLSEHFLSYDVKELTSA